MEWLPETIKEYGQFMDGNRTVRDPVERALMDIQDSLQRAWKNNKCQACPIAELVATAAATLKFYQESKGRK